MDLTTIDHLLTTTRSVRKRLDLMRPVEPEVIEHCIEIALQAPTGSNLQGWHFLVVADAAKRAALADLYRQAHIAYYNMQQAQPPQYRQDDLRARQRARASVRRASTCASICMQSRCISSRASKNAWQRCRTSRH